MPTVTKDRTAAKRKRRQRERQRAAAQPLLYQSEDWQLFLRRETLPQKAGCEPAQIGRIVLKEITDNGLDTGSTGVTIEPITGGYRITDGGPGIDPAEIPTLFAVNRPLLSSKLKRLPLRGMLGNGLRVVMGAVAAYGGAIAVTSRGRRQVLAIDPITGTSSVASDTMTRLADGTTVEITLPVFDGSELNPAKLTLTVARSGTQYTGPSQPAWYGPDDLRLLFTRVQPATTTVAHIVRDVFALNRDDDRIAAALAAAEVAQLHRELSDLAAARRVASIGCIGNDANDHYSGRIDGVARIGAAEIPFCVECWAVCQRAERGDNTRYWVELLINRSPTVAPLHVHADSDGLSLYGCGLDMLVGGKRARYGLRLSVITPYVLLTNDGKSPLLDNFREAIRRAVQKAAGSAYRAMVKPPTKMSVIDASWEVMEKAYLAASENLPGRPGRLPAKARQIMYAARPDILELTGRKSFTDSWFTQHCLPDFVDAHPKETFDWTVVFDARGDMVEPHTGLSLGLGTAEVDAYLGGRPRQGPAVRLSTSILYPTHGPEHRYKAALYIEKQGFTELMEAAQIQERFDMMVMSNKGMTVIATRNLIDHLVQRGVENIFVLHDFDISGFSILGTIGTSGRRYTFKNKMPIIDVGLRLEDVQAMGLQSEPFTIGKGTAGPDVTRRNGAKEAEIDFLYGRNGDGARRVELNAMTSRQIIELLERKFAEHGVTKVVPDSDIIEQHARRLFEQKLTKDALDKMRGELANQAAAHELPCDLDSMIRKLLAKSPALSWDQALAQVLRV